MKYKIGIIRPLNLGIIAATMLVILIRYRFEEAEHYFMNITLMILPAILTAAGGYIVNDIYDLETDKINRPEKLIAGHHISVKQSWLLYVILNVISLIISYLFSFQYAIINLCILAMLFVYSLRLKGMPLIGNLIVAVCSSAVIALCILINRNGEKIIEFETVAGLVNFTSYIIFAFFITLIRELVKDMEDLEGDSASGLRTYPIVAGVKGAKIIVYVFCGLEIVLCGIYSFLAFWATDMYVSAIIMCIITISLIYFINLLSKSKSREEYGVCSKWLKYLMFAGVINLIFA